MRKKPEQIALLFLSQELKKSYIGFNVFFLVKYTSPDEAFAHISHVLFAVLNLYEVNIKSTISVNIKN